MGVRSDGVGEDSDDDDDIVIGVGENFRKHIDALKRACVLEVGHGGYITTPASILSEEAPPAREEDEEQEDEDDDELFLSIKSKYGSFGYGDPTWFAKQMSREKSQQDDVVSEAAEEEDEEEDDEEILRSVEQLYNGGRGSGHQNLPKVVSPLKDKIDRNFIPRDDEGIHPSPLQQAGPGASGVDKDVGSSPQTSSEAIAEPLEHVGKTVASFLPGNWIETDGDVEYGDSSPAGPLDMILIQQEFKRVNSTPEETKKYARPENVYILADALKKNRECQITLRRMLSQIEAKQKENAELQKRVKTLVDFEKYCSRRFAGFFTDQANPSVKLIAAAKAAASQNKSGDASNKTVSDIQTFGPPENPDVEIYRRLQKKVSFTFLTRRWSNDERKELAKGVKQQVYEVLVRQAMDNLSSAAALDEEFNSLDDYMSKIGGKEFSPEDMRDALPGIDWDEVARVYVVGRTPEECQTRWINHEDALVNKGPWKKVEDKKLLSIAQQHNFCNWEKIADQLGTKRTPAECLIRYQRSLNASIMRSNWTPEEDSQLRAAVEEWGENDWSAVAACLEGRNNSQCLMRWYKVLHPTKKKRGRWSVEEDKRLKWAVSVYGPKKWKQIADHVPGRTDLQCRERWCNVLDPRIKLGEWTENEDVKLEESVAKHGPHRWAAVANDLKIRTDNQCCRRWKFLHPENQPEFQRTVHIRRTALVGNFQGRKKERPRLGPQDFTSKGTDFEAFAKKARGKRQEKAKPNEEVLDGPRERRAARILKRKLARAGKASNGKSHISESVPHVPMDNELMADIHYYEKVSRSGRVSFSTEVSNAESADTRMKCKAADISDTIEPSKGARKRTKRNSLQNADPKDSCNKSGIGRKRKQGQTDNPAGSHKGPKPNTRSSKQRLKVSDAQKSSQGVTSVVPEVSTFVDLLQSIESYCKCYCLVATGEEYPGFNRNLGVSEIQEPAESLVEELSHRKCSRQLGGDLGIFEDSEQHEKVSWAREATKLKGTENNIVQKGMKTKLNDRGYSDHYCSETNDTEVVAGEPQSEEVRDKDFSRGLDSSNHSCGQLSHEDEEVAFATRAVLSSPFFEGVQELLVQGTTLVGSQGPTVWGSEGITDLVSEGTRGLGSQGIRNFGCCQGATELSSQKLTDLGSQGMISSGPQGHTDLGSEKITDLGSQGKTIAGRNAVKSGMNKEDGNSIPSTAVRRPRSQRPFQMRGSLASKKM